MSSNFANLRIGTRLLILTPLLGIEYYVFQLPFDLLPLIVIMACATSVLLEYKVIHIALSKQPNEPARQLLIQKMNRFG